MMFIWLIVIVLVVLSLEKNKEHSGYTTHKENPLEVLDKRFISDEITEEEYRNKKKLLKK